MLYVRTQGSSLPCLLKDKLKDKMKIKTKTLENQDNKILHDKIQDNKTNYKFEETEDVEDVSVITCHYYSSFESIVNGLREEEFYIV